MPIDGLPPVQSPQQQLLQQQEQGQVFPLANPASEEAKVLSPEKRLPVTGRKGKGAKAEQERAKTQLSRREAEKLAQKLNQIMGLIEKRLLFKVSEEKDSALDEIQVKVIDQKTGKVLAIIPPKNLQELLGNVKDAVGILFDAWA
ncbi:FlaG protein [Acididesulfobacillus acetoxydans]|uniref:FlaG protein n=2 Tax=Acididesulfobacillus acetoxydans TaxID=1561005 RepID=A0A8S0XD64_9FIRM|nr:FlaG protein [Acididesulfobacillus acetoxydans]CEJ07596.1 FlaG protein [Acididesulfobacillus acetoxydans]